MPSVVCPAGEAIGELSRGGRLCGGCLCRVEQTVITPVEDPTTFIRRCTREPGVAPARTDRGEVVAAPDGYTACQTWRTEKGRRIAARLHEKGGDWWQINEATGRIEYLDDDKRAMSHEEALAA